MDFYIVDAFTNELFGGNPAGVVIVEGENFPTDEIMIKTAAELRYSETAFIRHIKDSEYEVRYFTPTDEVDLCGHATIATFSVVDKIKNIGKKSEGLPNQSACSINQSACSINESGKLGNNKAYIAHTKAGSIQVDVSDNLVMMEMAKPELIKTIDDISEWNEIRNILGLKEKLFGEKISSEIKSPSKLMSSLTPALVSTGLPDILFPVDSLEELNSIEPDFDAMSKLSERENAVGVHAYTIIEKSTSLNENNNMDLNSSGDVNSSEIHSRNFAPLFGIPEEAATGTSNGALTYYLHSKGLIKDGIMNSVEQGAAMGRPSRIFTTASKNDDGGVMIKVGGSARILAEGELFI